MINFHVLTDAINTFYGLIGTEQGRLKATRGMLLLVNVVLLTYLLTYFIRDHIDICTEVLFPPANSRC